MFDYKKIIDISQLQKERGRQTVKHRFIFDSLSQSEGKHMVGLVGPRGVGKTVLLKQLAAHFEDSVYISADSISDIDLFEVIDKLVRVYGFKNIFIDEVHVAKNFSVALKSVFDLLPVGRIFFSSSIAILLNLLPADLSRRLILHPVLPFSFREYLFFKWNRTIPRLSISQIMGNEIPAEIYQCSAYFSDYLSGGLMPYALEEPEPLVILKNILESVLETDVLRTQRVTMEDIDMMRKMVIFISRSPGVDGISYSSLSKNLAITKYKANLYSELLEKAFVVVRVKPYGTSVNKEPKILLMPPFRLLERSYADAIGGLREDYFVMAWKSIVGEKLNSLAYLKSERGAKTPDFVVEIDGTEVVLEIGGASKSFTQFKDFKSKAKKIILAQDAAAISTSDLKIPLHALGFL